MSYTPVIEKPVDLKKKQTVSIFIELEYSQVDDL